MEAAEKNGIRVCSREDLLNERGFSFLVFRADYAGHIVSGFPLSRFERDGVSIYGYDFKVFGVREYIQKMLSGYSRAPFLINADMGCALIIRSMTPATNLCAVLILEASVNCIKSLAASGALDLVVLPPGPCGRPGEKNKFNPREAEITERAYKHVKTGFYSFCSEDNLPNNAESLQKATNTVRSLAYLACCTCICTVDERVFNIYPFGTYRKFDSDIFTVFTLLSLLTLGRAGTKREAKLRYGILNGEPIIDIEAEILDEASYFPEIDECRRIADRRRLLFEYSFIKDRDKNALKIRFSPVRYDWSIIGVKNNMQINSN